MKDRLMSGIELRNWVRTSISPCVGAALVWGALGPFARADDGTHDYHWTRTVWTGETDDVFAKAEYWSGGVAPKGDAEANLYLQSVVEPDYGNHDGGFYANQSFTLPSDYLSFNSIQSSMPGQCLVVSSTGGGGYG